MNILTKDDSFICHSDMSSQFDQITSALDNAELRGAVNKYFADRMPEFPTKKDEAAAFNSTIQKFPDLIDQYIKLKEDNKDSASEISIEKLRILKKQLTEPMQALANKLVDESEFCQ